MTGTPVGIRLSLACLLQMKMAGVLWRLSHRLDHLAWAVSPRAGREKP